MSAAAVGLVQDIANSTGAPGDIFRHDNLHHNDTNIFDHGLDDADDEDFSEIFAYLPTGALIIYMITFWIVGTLSLLASSSIFFVIVKHRHYAHDLYHRLIMGMCFYDVLTSGSILTAPLWNRADTGLLLALGNTTTCNIAAFVGRFQQATLIYKATLSVYFLITIRFNIKEDRARQILEPYVHLVALAYPLYTGAASWVQNLTNPNAFLLYCIPSPSPYPPPCAYTDTDRPVPCEGGETDNLFLSYSNVILFFVTSAVGITCTWIVYAHVRASLTQMSRRYGRAASNTNDTSTHSVIRRSRNTRDPSLTTSFLVRDEGNLTDLSNQQDTTIQNNNRSSNNINRNSSGNRSNSMFSLSNWSIRLAGFGRSYYRTSNLAVVSQTLVSPSNLTPSQVQRIQDLAFQSVLYTGSFLANFCGSLLSLIGILIFATRENKLHDQWPRAFALLLLLAILLPSQGILIWCIHLRLGALRWRRYSHQRRRQYLEHLQQQQQWSESVGNRRLPPAPPLISWWTAYWRSLQEEKPPVTMASSRRNSRQMLSQYSSTGVESLGGGGDRGVIDAVFGSERAVTTIPRSTPKEPPETEPREEEMDESKSRKLVETEPVRVDDEPVEKNGEDDAVAEKDGPTRNSNNNSSHSLARQSHPKEENVEEQRRPTDTTVQFSASDEEMMTLETWENEPRSPLAEEKEGLVALPTTYQLSEDMAEDYDVEEPSAETRQSAAIVKDVQHVEESDGTVPLVQNQKDDEKSPPVIPVDCSDSSTVEGASPPPPQATTSDHEDELATRQASVVSVPAAESTNSAIDGDSSQTFSTPAQPLGSEDFSGQTEGDEGDEPPEK